MKDYYSILELPPSASVDEIKKSYRRLAHIYHPDKNGNDAYAAVQFSAIKEAYETLTNPLRKDHYLQQRWYAQSQGKKRFDEFATPVVLLKKILELDRYVSRLDFHRMDHLSLYEYMDTLLSDPSIQMLRSFNEPDVNRQILQTALNISGYLPYPLLEKLAIVMRNIPVEPTLLAAIDSKLRASRNGEWWEKRRPVLILFLVLIICVLIYWLGK